MSSTFLQDVFPRFIWNFNNFGMSLRDKLTSAVRTYSVHLFRSSSFLILVFHCGPVLPALTPMRVFILRRLNRSLWSGILTIKTPTTLSTGLSASAASWHRGVRPVYAIFNSDLMEGKYMPRFDKCSSKTASLRVFV